MRALHTRRPERRSVARESLLSISRNVVTTAGAPSAGRRTHPVCPFGRAGMRLDPWASSPVAPAPGATYTSGNPFSVDMRSRANAGCRGSRRMLHRRAGWAQRVTVRSSESRPCPLRGIPGGWNPVALCRGARRRRHDRRGGDQGCEPTHLAGVRGCAAAHPQIACERDRVGSAPRWVHSHRDAVAASASVVNGRKRRCSRRTVTRRWRRPFT